MSGGELFERITADGYTMSEAEAINYMRQICEAVKHMHEKNIVHLDLKVIIFIIISFFWNCYQYFNLCILQHIFLI